jgi:RNA polymerase sigma-70 factor (ECF subfamily)
MPETPLSLLERLRQAPDPTSWQRLVDLYTPLIHGWLRRQLVNVPDIDDLSQEVLTVVVRELPNFEHDLRKGAFRRWLKLITVNRLRTFWRRRKNQPQAAGNDEFEHVLTQLEDPDSALSRLWEQEHDQFIIRRLLELLEPEFEPSTWRAFRGLVLEEKDTNVVAAELGITPNAVRIAKSRVMSRFRREVEGLID